MASFEQQQSATFVMEGVDCMTFTLQIPNHVNVAEGKE
jgi:hypothetical protein